MKVSDVLLRLPTETYGNFEVKLPELTTLEAVLKLREKIKKAEINRKKGEPVEEIVDDLPY